MIQQALFGVDSGVVMEVDADEMWRANQIEGIYECLKGAEDGATMQFHCNFFCRGEQASSYKRGLWLELV